MRQRIERGCVCVGAHVCVWLKDESNVSTGHPKLNTLNFSLESSSGTQDMAELR